MEGDERMFEVRDNEFDNIIKYHLLHRLPLWWDDSTLLSLEYVHVLHFFFTFVHHNQSPRSLLSENVIGLKINPLEVVDLWYFEGGDS